MRRTRSGNHWAHGLSELRGLGAFAANGTDSRPSPDDPTAGLADLLAPVLVGKGPTTLFVTDPEDGSLVAELPKDSADSVAIAVRRAATKAVEPLPTHRRVGILTDAAQLVAANRQLFADVVSREGVKTLAEAESEVDRCVSTLMLSGEAARALGGETLPFDDRPGLEQRIGYFRRRPVGVIAAVTPFNDPLNLVAHKVGPALAAGNAVVLKPDERTPIASLLLARALQAVGLPDGFLNVLLGPGVDLIPALVSHAAVRLVSVTGGERLAQAVRAAAPAKRAVMELGGVCPVIVCEDADIDLAAAAITAGAFAAAGQNCLRPQLVLAADAIYDRLRDLLAQRAASLRTGSKRERATDVGPMIDEAAALRVHGMVSEAVVRGARLINGGVAPWGRPATRLAPTLIEDVPAGSALWKQEIFGPVTVLARVADGREGLVVAGQTDGLQAGIFTASLSTALEAVRVLPHGAVAVNDTDLRYDGMPFGGTGAAASGREGPLHAALEMSETQVVSMYAGAATVGGVEPMRSVLV